MSDQQLPSHGEVFDELDLLRLKGLSYVPVRDHAPKLQSLPSVDHEMEIQRWVGDSRPDAAVRVVRCASSRLIRDVWSAQFLHETLIEPDSQLNSDERLYSVGQKIKPPVTTKASLKQLREKSYHELSGALLVARRTPCQGPDATEIEGLAEGIRADFNKVVDLLLLFARDYAPVIRAEAAELVLEALPKGRNQVRARLPAVGSAELLSVLIALALRKSGRVIDEVDRFTYEAAPINALLSVEYWAVGLSDDVAARIEITPSRVDQGSRRTFASQVRFNQLRDVALRELEAQLLSEERVGWPSIAATFEGRAEQLTPRELTILRLLAEKAPEARIAESMGVSVKTVREMTVRIAEKLGVSATESDWAQVLHSQSS